MTNICTYVTGPDKTGLIALFCISRNSILNALCFSGGLIQSRQISCIISVAISTSYLNVAGFLDGFFQCL